MTAGPKATRRLTTGPSLADQAYDALREDITTGRLNAETRITERLLAQRLGVSPTPVREALTRLEHEHLIERGDGNAIRVAQPSLSRLHELSLIEAALRGVAARIAGRFCSGGTWPSFEPFRARIGHVTFARVGDGS